MRPGRPWDLCEPECNTGKHAQHGCTWAMHVHATHERERKEQHLTHEQTLKPSYQPIKEKTKEALREVHPEKCEGRPGPDLGTGACMKRSAACRKRRKLRRSTEALIFLAGKLRCQSPLRSLKLRRENAARQSQKHPMYYPCQSRESEAEEGPLKAKR